MPQLSRKEIKKRRRKLRRLAKRSPCRFCPDGCNRSPRPVYVDYKDMATLRAMIDRDGKILPRRKAGNCAKYQRAVRRALLRARFLALLR